MKKARRGKRTEAMVEVAGAVVRVTASCDSIPVTGTHKIFKNGCLLRARCGLCSDLLVSERSAALPGGGPATALPYNNQGVIGHNFSDVGVGQDIGNGSRR